VSNADFGRTIAKILKLDIPAKGQLLGRAIDEAMPNGQMPRVETHTLQSAPAANGLRTILNFQQIGTTKYFDAAGFPGRTVGLTGAASN
jgi:hypothetical protein